MSKNSVRELAERMYYIPGTNPDIQNYPEVKAQVFLFDCKGPCAALFVGRSTKPRFKYRYKSIDLRTEAVTEAINNLKAVIADKEKRALERKLEDVKAAEKLKVGDIFVCSWGYEQTNVDFYQVTKKKGLFCHIQEIENEKKYRGDMDGTATPVPNAFKSEPMKKKIQAHGLKIASYASASLWGGKPQFFSCWY